MEITFKTLMKLKKVTEQGQRDYRSVGLDGSMRKVVNGICEDGEIPLIAGTLIRELRKIKQRAGLDMEKVDGPEDSEWVAIRSTPLPYMSDQLKEDRAYLNRLLNEKDFNEVVQELKQEKRLECQKCGHCCTVHENKYLNKNPYERCKHMTDDNLCSIYDTDYRRRICPGKSILFSKDKDLYFIVSTHVLDLLKEVCFAVKEFWERMMEKERMRELRELGQSGAKCHQANEPKKG